MRQESAGQGNQPLPAAARGQSRWTGIPGARKRWTLARASGKPILLSIGYSACHWCHVMAHESFEDAATAQLMNELFVNIKVDREERPDLDKIYQVAHQVLTQRGGGWPLTMFLTHDDQKPFFGGTYFPDRRATACRRSPTILKRVAEYYREQRAELRAQNDTLMDVFGDLTPRAGRGDDRARLPRRSTARAQQLGAVLRQAATAASAARRSFRIPAPSTGSCITGTPAPSAQAPDLQALYMATLTLTRMAEGGIYDQLGGGFAATRWTSTG